ncbi:MAG: hypothetical protein ACLQU1_24160 [Bryobacteraceae bacterium]
MGRSTTRSTSWKRNNQPSDADKKKLKDLKKKREDIRKKVLNASSNLTVNLTRITINPQANQNEVAKLPNWLKTIVKEKGIPISQEMETATDIVFDSKNRRLCLTLTHKWNF